MPTPLPAPGQAKLTPPDRAEVAILSQGVASAVAPAGGLSETQKLLMQAVFTSMTGYPATFDTTSADPAWFAQSLATRNVDFRTRMVQVMVLLALVLNPLPEEVALRIASFAAELSVNEGMLEVARGFADGSLELATHDFERNGYMAMLEKEGGAALHTSAALASAWDFDDADHDLAGRWQAMEHLPADALGRRVTDFYRARGFIYPGLPGSAPPLLAQHDWVHVLADYGTTLEAELEVFAFIARANDDLGAFSLLAMVVSLFETGYLLRGAGLFEASPGHLSERGMAGRVADAMRRGATCEGSIDFMKLDWFELAARPVSELRGEFGVLPKAKDAVAAGSAGPWDAGGISEYQVNAGRALAGVEGRAYSTYGAQPLRPA
ncbi:MAG: hypothetical protein ACRDZ8_19825 [Acidimicrobiales bacterium]